MPQLDEIGAKGHSPDRLPADRDPLEWIAGRLHNCTDQMPGADSEYYLDGLRGTYAKGAQWVIRQLDDPVSSLSRRSGARDLLSSQIREDIAHDDATKSDERSSASWPR